MWQRGKQNRTKKKGCSRGQVRCIESWEQGMQQKKKNYKLVKIMKMKTRDLKCVKCIKDDEKSVSKGGID